VVLKLSLGDSLRLKKRHPCGGYNWRVVRLGADIGLECLECGRRTMVSRVRLEGRVREVVPWEEG